MVVGDFAHEKDILVIGGGPGGYHAAIRAAQLGKEVALIERKRIGGTCLNESCIPSKLFANAGATLQSAHKFETFGITGSSSLSLDLSKLQHQKSELIHALTQGVEALLKKHKIERVQGSASFISDSEIGVEEQERFEKYKFEKAIIATGAVYQPDTNLPSGEARVLTGADPYELEELPEHLVLYGSDYITLEIAASFSKFGTKVTLILDEEKESFPFDQTLNRELMRLLKKQQINVYKKTKLLHALPKDDMVEISLVSPKGETTLEASHFYAMAQPQPNTKSLRLEAASIETTSAGFIPITTTTQTNNPRIYAVGDVTASGGLAVEAIKQGKVAGEHAAGENSEWDPDICPVIAHTVKPLASVGLTEEEALHEGYEVSTNQFPLASNGYAGITADKDGMVKVISEKETDVLLGYHAIGTGSVELISTAIQALEMGGRIEDMIYPYYPHPSINEAWLEATEGLLGKAVHGM
ncbi:dihydrolipoyl dehydrogenase family protein [Salsuginibacillus kocurii]|uniref:dihydrolipoyl dehydrogenase family protein n=1 Tax=Salsuginibacillus kocurii TaxID=427078 RepID=UPI00037DA865|nr:NAD(P)/FAD-dependent oxidoreductase [Salsuginibacillus kocurii]